MLDENLLASARVLERESGVSLDAVDAADNVDLRGVLREWELAHEAKHGRRPTLAREVDRGRKPTGPGEGISAARVAAAPGRAGATAGAERRRARVERERAEARDTEMARRAAEQGVNVPNEADVYAGQSLAPAQFDLTPGHPLLRRYAEDGPIEAPEGGTALSNALAAAATRREGKDPSRVRVDADAGDGVPESFSSSEEEDGALPRRVLRPPPSFGGDAELRALSRVITRDIFTRDPGVRFSDVAGLDVAKRLLREAVVMPVRYPQFFTGLLAPWRGVLLYGPPGTGKTMLAKAVATECGTTFFNISASSVVSKWRGDSEKLVRVLFELARHHAPSTVFLDEIDAVMSARDGEGGEGGGGGGGDHEASRRMKTELLIQLDGLNSAAGATQRHPRAESESQSGAEAESAGSLVFLLAATNLPWSLDPALLRRLEKRVMVPLPSEEAREKMIAGMLARRAISNSVDFAELARRTEGFSGSDVATLCKEMAMRPLRRLMERLDERGFEGEGAAGGEEGGEGDGDKGTRLAGGDDGLALGEISGEDAEGALAATKPSFTQAHARRYVAWTESFGVAAGG